MVSRSPGAVPWRGTVVCDSSVQKRDKALERRGWMGRVGKREVRRERRNKTNVGR